MGFMPVVTRSFFVYSSENRGDIEVKRATGRQDNERNMLLIMAQWHTGMGRGTDGFGNTPTTVNTPYYGLSTIYSIINQQELNIKQKQKHSNHTNHTNHTKIQ